MAFVQNFIGKRRVIVMLGAGGVGKTTCSVALALALAREGKKVGLLSIDPARRLADAIGLPLSHQIQKIQFPEHPELHWYGAMMDQKAIFDKMVLEHAPNPETARKILAHPLYLAISDKLAGAVEFMALAVLKEMLHHPEIDIVVLDTPPATHALDFLQKPNILQGFAEQKIMNWLVKPFHLANKLGFGKLLSMGERLMGGIAELAGFQALGVFSEFLVLIQQVIEGFQAAGDEIATLLRSEETGFVLVNTVHPSSKRTQESLVSELKRMQLHWDGVILNRTIAPTLLNELHTLSSQNVGPHLSQFLENIEDRLSFETELIHSMLKNLRSFNPSIKLLLIPESTISTNEREYILNFSNFFLN